MVTCGSPPLVTFRDPLREVLIHIDIISGGTQSDTKTRFPTNLRLVPGLATVHLTSALAARGPTRWRFRMTKPQTGRQRFPAVAGAKIIVARQGIGLRTLRNLAGADVRVMKQ